MTKLAKTKPRDESVAAYVRVSSASQTGRMQREAIRQASAARGDTIFSAQWYEEKESARTTDRPLLTQLRADIRAGKVRRLYVWKLDRLTRSGIRDTLGLVDEFKRHGCTLVTIADGFDLAGPAAEVVLAVLAWAAQVELSFITERRAAARARVIAQGGTWGRPRSLTPEIEARVLAMMKEGKSVRAISMAVRKPRATIDRAIRRLKSAVPNGGTPKGKTRARVAPTPPPSH